MVGHDKLHDDHPDPPKLDNPMNVKFLEEKLNTTTPRMILTPDTKDLLLQKLNDGDKVLVNMSKALQKNAKHILELPVVKREMTGKRLLKVARAVLYRMNILGMQYYVNQSTIKTKIDDETLLERINEEILAVCAFSDWNPGHFLDIGEMCMAISLGIDWVGHLLPEETVVLAKENLIAKGLEPSYPKKPPFWMQTHSNWNQVCHGGLIAAAVCVAEVNPELAANTIHRALDCMPFALQQYGPDGIYPEGPAYWEYGTSYTVMASNILTTAFGTDFGIAKYPAFEKSAMFRAMASSQTTGWFYNFSDCADRRCRNGDIVLAWFAAQSGNPLFFEESRFLSDWNKMAWLSGLSGAGMVWLAQYEPKCCADGDCLPEIWKGHGSNPLLIIKCNDEHHDDDHTDCQYYLGAKGGKGSNSHGNMDAGSFIFELDGVRWSVDPGSQKYDTLEKAGLDLWHHHQDSDRWKLLTKNNLGHSTLTVNHQLHRVDAMADITKFDNEGDVISATVDMSKVFGSLMKKAHRTFTKDSPTSILIEDELEVGDDAEVITWQMMTTAHVTVDDDKFGCILDKDGKKLQLDLVSDIDEVPVSILSMDPPPFNLDRKIAGLKRIDINFPAYLFGDDKKGKISIRLSRIE